jgi:hypothetical protein
MGESVAGRMQDAPDARAVSLYSMDNEIAAKNGDADSDSEFFS